MDLDRCAPDMECNDDDVVSVSSEEQHLAANLGVTGSTPVPPTADLRELAPPGAKASNMKPEGGGYP